MTLCCKMCGKTHVRREANRALLEWYLRKEDPNMPVHKWELRVDFAHHRGDQETIDVVNKLIASTAGQLWAILGQMPSKNGEPHVALASADDFKPYKDQDFVNAPPVTASDLLKLGIVISPPPQPAQPVADEYADIYADMAAMAREDRT